MVSNKAAFWQALVFTLIIFGLGILLGYLLEQSRTNEIQFKLVESEINLLDEQARNLGINQFNINCNLSKQSLFSFANRIYEEALDLEQYESKSKFDNTLRILHKKYDILRVMLWAESINLKKRCSNDFHTIVYIFDYSTGDINLKAEQIAISRMLLDIKAENQEKILLIPIAGNLDVSSVNLIKDKYNITKLPSIIIDENETIISTPNQEELTKKIFK